MDYFLTVACFKPLQCLNDTCLRPKLITAKVIILTLHYNKLLAVILGHCIARFLTDGFGTRNFPFQ